MTFKFRPLIPGVLLSLVVALAAMQLHTLPMWPFSVISAGQWRHPVSPDIIAILLGVLIRNLLPIPWNTQPGCKWIVQFLIPVSIVLMGTSLDLAKIKSVGIAAMAIVIVCIGVATWAGRFFGIKLGMSPKAALLVGAGTGICGSSAIVAVAPLIDAKDEDLVVSLATINLYGLLVMLIYPLIGAALHLSQPAFAVWCGTAIHSVPQVLGAAFAFGNEAGTMATLVKLVRISMLAPLVFLVAVWVARGPNTVSQAWHSRGLSMARMVPWFVWGFVATAALNTLGWIPNFSLESPLFAGNGATGHTLMFTDFLKESGKFLLTLSMAAIGLEVDIRQLAGAGAKALAAGLFATLCVGAASLGMVYLLIQS